MLAHTANATTIAYHQIIIVYKREQQNPRWHVRRQLFEKQIIQSKLCIL